MKEPGRNDPCPCGSGKKYKQCCGRADRVTPEGTYERIRRLDGAASDGIGRLFKRMRSREDFLAAHAAFHPGQEGVLDPDDPEVEFFLRWLYYDWLPEDGDPPAEAFIESADTRVDPDVFTLVEKTIESPYSYLQVTAVRPGESFDVRDILRKREFTIIERGATQTARPGHILYARVVEWDGVHFMMGNGPQVIPAEYLGEIADLRDGYLKEKGTPGEPIPDEDLLTIEGDLRLTYFDLRDGILQRKTDIQNTDGDPMLFHTIRYEVTSFDQAFAVLKDLDPDATEEELMDASGDDPEPAGNAAVIHWSKRKKKGPPGDDIVQAVIRIRGNELIVEVNSAKRAARVRKEIGMRLGKDAIYLGTEIATPEGAMKKARQSGGSDDAAKRADEQARLMALPEVQAKLKEMLDRHWATWPDTPIPALRGMTPRHAARDPRGRELLESLLLDFEARNSQGPGGFERVDVTKLRKELGMERR